MILVLLPRLNHFCLTQVRKQAVQHGRRDLQNGWRCESSSRPDPSGISDPSAQSDPSRKADVLSSASSPVRKDPVSFRHFHTLQVGSERAPHFILCLSERGKAGTRGAFCRLVFQHIFAGYIRNIDTIFGDALYWGYDTHNPNHGVMCHN
jgi:hypothetical protein